MSFTEWIVEHTRVYPYHGTLLSNKKAWIIGTHSHNEPLGNYTEFFKRKNVPDYMILLM